MCSNIPVTSASGHAAVRGSRNRPQRGPEFGEASRFWKRAPAQHGFTEVQRIGDAGQDEPDPHAEPAVMLAEVEQLALGLQFRNLLGSREVADRLRTFAADVNNGRSRVVENLPARSLD